MDVTSSSDSESESEIATPSGKENLSFFFGKFFNILVSNLKSRFSVKNGGDKPLVIQPIHEPVIRREPLYLRNRFHKEPTNQEDIIRSDHGSKFRQKVDCQSEIFSNQIAKRKRNEHQFFFDHLDAKLSINLQMQIIYKLNFGKKRHLIKI